VTVVIIIDTNVISEMMRDEPDPKVLAWAATAGRLHTTAITLSEVDYGIARLPAGRRRDRLTAAAAEVFADFDDVMVPFDARAARRYGEIVANREAAGRPIATADAQIAAICASREASLATRNMGDFDATGIGVINPWEGPFQ
jgi:predicted nucleic acid-binding protein